MRTQAMLAVLREAGVVDAGAAGLVEFCRGAVAGARGEHIHAPLESIDRPLSLEAVHQEESQYRYCTSFLLEGDDIDRDRLETELVAMGDCLLVVGEAPMCRVHLHTDDPGAALSRAVAMGSIDRVSIANMQEQTRQREERLRSGAEARRAARRPAADDRLTAANTAIVLDSTADLPHPEQEHPNWRMVPLIVRFGEEQFEDWVGIEPAEFYRRLRDGGPHPQTAAPSPGAYLRMFEQLGDYAHVIVLPVSSRVSGSVQAARIAADDPAAGGRVTVLDGHSVSVGTGMLADGVQRLLEAGTTIDGRHGVGRGRPRAPASRDLRRHARVPAPRRPDQPHTRAGGKRRRPASAAHAARRRAGPLPPRRRRPRPGAARVRALPVRARAGRRRCARRARPRRRSGGRRAPGGGGAPAAAAGADRAGVRARRRRRHARRAGHARAAGAGGAVTRAFAGEALPAEGFPRPRSAPDPAHLREPATTRKTLAAALAALRPRPVVTVDDLLEHTPFRHEDYRSTRTLAEIAPGEEATVICTVERVRMRPTRRRNLVIVEAAVRDESGPGVVIWFNQRYLAKQLRPGMRLSIRGERRPTIDAEIVAKSYERADDESGGAAHRGPRARVPGVGAGLEPPAARARRRGARTRGRPGRPGARPRQAAPRAAAAARRAHRRPPPRHAGAGLRRARRGSPTTSSSCSSSACSSGARRFDAVARALPLPPPGELCSPLPRRPARSR